MKDLKEKGKRQKAKFEPRKREFEERKPLDRKSEDSRPKPEPSRNLIFGMLPILEALRANSRRIEKILIADGAREHRISEIMDLARAAHVPFQKVSRESL